MRDTFDTGIIRSQGLSPELIIKILHCCERSTILRFAATCKAYCELVAQSTSLQLHIELEANGLELVKVFKQDVTYSMILEDIKQFRDPWFDLDFRESAKRSLGETRGILWRLRQGFYIKAFSQSRGQYADALQFIPLDPQALDPPPLMFEFKFWAFATDPGQELAAMISRDTDRCNICHVHLRSSVTGLVHSLAGYPRLSAEFDFEVSFQSGYAVDIEIMERMVFAKISNHRPSVYELLIWDWRLGTLLHRISFERGTYDFTFLDQKHLVVLASASDGLALLVYDISHSTPISLASPNEPLWIDHLPISWPIVHFEFPRLSQSTRISDTRFFIRSDPIPCCTIQTNSAEYLYTHAQTLSLTFYCRPVDTISNILPSYRVFVDGLSILNHVRTNSRDETVVIPWSSWGPASTRWLLNAEESGHLTRWPHWMDGSRYIPPLSSRRYHYVYDFSPLTVSQLQQLLERHRHEYIANLSSNSVPFVVVVDSGNPTLISGSTSGFDKTITSRLPYRYVFRKSSNVGGRQHTCWQIVGDCVIGIDAVSNTPNSITIYRLNK